MVNFLPFQAGSGLPLSAASKAAWAVLASHSIAVGKPLIICWAGAGSGVGVTTTSTCFSTSTIWVSTTLTSSSTTWVTTFSTIFSFSITCGVGGAQEVRSIARITMTLTNMAVRFMLGPP